MIINTKLWGIDQTSLNMKYMYRYRTELKVTLFKMSSHVYNTRFIYIKVRMTWRRKHIKLLFQVNKQWSKSQCNHMILASGEYPSTTSLTGSLLLELIHFGTIPIPKTCSCKHVICLGVLLMAQQLSRHQLKLNTLHFWTVCHQCSPVYVH